MPDIDAATSKRRSHREKGNDCHSLVTLAVMSANLCNAGMTKVQH